MHKRGEEEYISYLTKCKECKIDLTYEIFVVYFFLAFSFS
jgi:hypothetical protein